MIRVISYSINPKDYQTDYSPKEMSEFYRSFIDKDICTKEVLGDDYNWKLIQVMKDPIDPLSILHYFERQENFFDKEKNIFK